VARKAALLFNDFEVPDNEDYRAARGFLPLLRALPTFGWIAGLGLVGLARAPGLGRRGWLLAGFVGTLVSEVLLTFNLGRYRLALAALLLVCAGAGADRLLGSLRAGSRGGRRGLLGAGIAVAASAYAFIPPLDLDLGHRDAEERRYREEVLAAAAQRDALPALAAAAAIPPPSAERLHALGAACALAGLIPEAENAFVGALGADPGHLPSHWELARIADRTGRPAAAAARLRAMAGIAPDDPLVRFAFGSTLARLADDDPARARQYAAEAREQLERAVGLEPALTGAWYQLARLSWLAGDDARAGRELARAIAAGPENAAALRLRERVLRGPEPL
jgi:tetratricopeptide (TPR) repeat protein